MNNFFDLQRLKKPKRNVILALLTAGVAATVFGSSIESTFGELPAMFFVLLGLNLAIVALLSTFLPEEDVSK